MTKAPPGLYPDPDPRRLGKLRYWTGEQWTEPYWTPVKVVATCLLGGLLCVLPLLLYVCAVGAAHSPPGTADQSNSARCMAALLFIGLIVLAPLLRMHWKGLWGRR